MTTEWPKLKLISARYGYTPAKAVDALPRLQRIQKENEGAVKVDAKEDLNLLFSDPEPGAPKKLSITYQYGDGDVLTDEYPEKHDSFEYMADDRPEHKVYGKMHVTVHRASDLRDVESFGSKMDPYFIAECGLENFKSKVANKQHRNPSWDDSFVLNLDGKADTLHLKFYDSNRLKDSIIGRCDLALGMLCGTSGPTWFDVVEFENFNKIAGKVLLTTSFTGRGGGRAKKAAAAVKPAPRPEPTLVVFMQAPAPAVVIAAAPAGAPAAAAAAAAPAASGGEKAPELLYAPPAPLTAPLCNLNHPLTDYTSRKPAGYFDEYKCDYCGKQHRFGPGVRFFHCDVCKTFDCCVPCGEKFIGKSVPPFKAANCPAHHSLLPGWNTTPAWSHEHPTFKCGKCGKSKAFVPGHDYYSCKACKYAVCGDCMNHK